MSVSQILDSSGKIPVNLIGPELNIDEVLQLGNDCNNQGLENTSFIDLSRLDASGNIAGSTFIRTNENPNATDSFDVLRVEDLNSDLAGVYSKSLYVIDDESTSGAGLKLSTEIMAGPQWNNVAEYVYVKYDDYENAIASTTMTSGTILQADGLKVENVLITNSSNIIYFSETAPKNTQAIVSTTSYFEVVFGTTTWYVPLFQAAP